MSKQLKHLVNSIESNDAFSSKINECKSMV